MDLELGLKITHTIDDVASSADFRIVKDKSGPLFVSKETESSFILTIHLKGYRREHIEIDINENGTKIGILGEKPVQEKVMLGWMMYKKEVEIRGFRKVFRIPHGVVLDRIKAKFDEQESILTIIMPKSVKGVVGVGIEEVKEDGMDIRRPQMTQTEAEEVPESDGSSEPERKRMEEIVRVKGKGVDEEGSKKEIGADGILEKDMRGSKMQEVKDSKTQSIQDTTKSASENSEEPKIEEGDGIEKEKVGRKELDNEEIAADKVPKREYAKGTIKEDTDKSTEVVTHEVAIPSQETQVTEPHSEETASDLPSLKDQMKKQKSSEAEREMPKAGLDEDVRSRPESSESTKTDQVQGKQFTDEICKEGDVVELQKQEPIKEDSANYQHEKGEGSHGIANEIQHMEKKKEIEKCESPERENQKDGGEKSTLEKQPEGLEKSKLLCSPFIIAGRCSKADDEAQEKQFTDGVRKEGDVVELQKQETIKEGPANYHHEKRERSHRIENEIQEATNNIEEEHIKEKKEVEKCESPEMEKQKDVGEKSTLEKQPASLQNSKLLCSPFIIASSVFLVSLAMIAINRIRTRKR